MREELAFRGVEINYTSHSNSPLVRVTISAPSMSSIAPQIQNIDTYATSCEAKILVLLVLGYESSKIQRILEISRPSYNRYKNAAIEKFQKKNIHELIHFLSTTGVIDILADFNKDLFA